jgi:hypothetical protein
MNDMFLIPRLGFRWFVCDEPDTSKWRRILILTLQESKIFEEQIDNNNRKTEDKLENNMRTKLGFHFFLKEKASRKKSFLPV